MAKKIDNPGFDRVLTLAFAFDENKKQDAQKVTWEEIKPEIEKLSLTQMEILLGLIKTKE